jgi:hypothetical protein
LSGNFSRELNQFLALEARESRVIPDIDLRHHPQLPEL